MFKLVIFDLDGVITDTAEYHYLAWKELAKKVKIDLDREFNEQLKGVSRMDSLERILQKNNMEETYNEAEKASLAEEKNELYQTFIENITPNDVLPGILELLRWIKEKNIHIALGSASKNGPKIIEKLNVNEWIDYIVDPSTVAASKPAPDLFLAAAEHFNIKPEECIVVEDAVSGIQAALSGKMYVIGVGNKDILKGANKVAADTNKLLDIFKEVITL